MADPGAMSMFGPTFKAVGGHILSHMSTTRVRATSMATPTTATSHPPRQLVTEIVQLLKQDKLVLLLQLMVQHYLQQLLLQ